MTDETTPQTDATGFDPRSYLRQLTQAPGVYRMYNAQGDVLYVGKAKNLKKRVSSYFLRASGNAKTEAMLDQVADIQVTITHTEDEALLNANAPGKSYEALATTPGVRGLPVARAPRRGAALRSHKIRSRM